MAAPWLDIELGTCQKKLIGDLLIKGKESATQLQTLLQKPIEDHGSDSAKVLASEIVRSFNETLSVLSSHGPGNEITQIVATDGAVGACSSNRSSKTPGEIRKRPAASKDRRGCYRRRNAPESRIIISSTPEDGYAWRKYGQKGILNSKFPRCYFRCTHKHDEGCKATKQVQRIKQEPLTYKTTYFGHHTCNDPMRAPQIISQESDDPIDSCLLSFETKVPTPSTQNSHCSGFIPTTTKEALLMEDTHSDISESKSLWQDLLTSESSVMPSRIADSISHHEEVVPSSISTDYACTSTTLHGLDIEAFSKFSELENDLCFDESDFFRIDDHQGLHSSKFLLGSAPFGLS